MSVDPERLAQRRLVLAAELDFFEGPPEERRPHQERVAEEFVSFIDSALRDVETAPLDMVYSFPVQFRDFAEFSTDLKRSYSEKRKRASSDLAEFNESYEFVRDNLEGLSELIVQRLLGPPPAAQIDPEGPITLQETLNAMGFGAEAIDSINEILPPEKHDAMRGIIANMEDPSTEAFDRLHEYLYFVLPLEERRTWPAVLSLLPFLAEQKTLREWEESPEQFANRVLSRVIGLVNGQQQPTIQDFVYRESPNLSEPLDELAAHRSYQYLEYVIMHNGRGAWYNAGRARTLTEEQVCEHVESDGQTPLSPLETKYFVILHSYKDHTGRDRYFDSGEDPVFESANGGLVEAYIGYPEMPEWLRAHCMKPDQATIDAQEHDTDLSYRLVESLLASLRLKTEL